MFDALKDWINGNPAEPVATGPSRGAPVPTKPLPEGEEDRRGAERYWFAGGEVFLFLPNDQCFRLRLRDVSTDGLSGITDAPLSPGELVMVQFEETFMPAAHVAWTRNAWVGLSVVNPMPEARLQRLCDRHKEGAAWSPAMRTASDLHSWWTDIQEVKKGRRVAVSRR